jgi:hypothetical protein
VSSGRASADFPISQINLGGWDGLVANALSLKIWRSLHQFTWILVFDSDAIVGLVLRRNAVGAHMKKTKWVGGIFKKSEIRLHSVKILPNRSSFFSTKS